MFRPNRPSSCVQVVVMTDSAAHCNAYVVTADSRLCGLESCLFGCLPYGFVGLWRVAVRNVSVRAKVRCMTVDHRGCSL
jgi:hypothetical protein